MVIDVQSFLGACRLQHNKRQLTSHGIRKDLTGLQVFIIWVVNFYHFISIAIDCKS